MTYIEVRREIKALVMRKGVDNILNADLNEIHERTGATYGQMQNAMSYFRYSPQTAKYRTSRTVDMMIEAYTKVMGIEKWNSMSAEEQHAAIMAMIKDTNKAIDKLMEEA